MKNTSLNRILLYTMLSIIVIATYITVNSYYTQVAIYQEKELFKLDCIANAVAYKISGSEHDRLVNQYPNASLVSKVEEDSAYKKIHMLMSMAVKMTQLPSDMYTVVKGNEMDQFFYAIGCDRSDWLKEISMNPPIPDSIYKKGGMLGRYNVNGESRLGTLSPLMNSEGQTVGLLKVEETFDSFLSKARNQIYFNILLSLAFIFVIGILMFFSVRNILFRQQKLAFERAEVEALRQELVANVSHDLRTPLASIHGFIETLLMKKDSLDGATRDKYLNTTLKSTERLRMLVDELFELSKLESKERKLNLERFSIGELCVDVVNHFKVSAEEKDISLTSNISEKTPLAIGDVALIDRVLQNLIGNSIRFCNHGESISVDVFQKNGEVWVSVHDSGTGISKDELPFVFDRFAKGKTSRSGTGLGLAIVKSILDLHDSKYDVKSEEGKGTTFEFSLRIG